MSGLVIVSPHLDDAVLSASAQVSRSGAHVITLCTGVPSAGTPLAWWDRLTGAEDAAQRVVERRAEDDAALATLGVSRTTRLDFPDGQHLPAARTDHDEFVGALVPLLADADEIWAPAGIGCHADHLATRDAVIKAAPEAAQLHHYADVPYSLRYGWPPSVTGQPAASPYLDVEAWLAEELVAAALGPVDPAPTVHLLDPDARARKVAAMACYSSQIPALDYGRVLADGDPAVVGFEVSWSRA